MDKSRSSLTKSDGTYIVKTKRSLADGGVLTKIRTEKYIDMLQLALILRIITLGLILSKRKRRE